MMLHVLLGCVVAIWMFKVAERNQLNKSKCVLWGLIGYAVFTVGIHYLLFVFGTEIYDNHRLVYAVNIISGLLGASMVSLIISQRGKKQKKLKE